MTREEKETTVREIERDWVHSDKNEEGKWRLDGHLLHPWPLTVSSPLVPLHWLHLSRDGFYPKSFSSLEEAITFSSDPLSLFLCESRGRERIMVTRGKRATNQTSWQMRRTMKKRKSQTHDMTCQSKIMWFFSCRLEEINLWNNSRRNISSSKISQAVRNVTQMLLYLPASSRHHRQTYAVVAFLSAWTSDEFASDWEEKIIAHFNDLLTITSLDVRDASLLQMMFRRIKKKKGH